MQEHALLGFSILLVLSLAFGSSIVFTASSQEYSIPSWIRTSASWWSASQIPDDEFAKSLEYLLYNNIVKVSQTSLSNSETSNEIPSWLQNNAGWWSQGVLSDDEFVNGVQYLVNNKIIRITSNAESLCSGDALCVISKVERIVDGDTIYVEGYKVRLSLTNTPEKNEQGFSEATDFTKRLCPVGSIVTIDQDDIQPYDVYDRLLGKVHCNDKTLNSELLLNSHASILTQYCSTSEFSSESWAQEYGCGESSKVSYYVEKSEKPLTLVLTATAISPSEIRLSWTSPDNLKESITSYLIEREVIKGVYDEVTHVSGSTTAYTVSELASGKTYSYSIIANLIEGDSLRSNSASATPETDPEQTISPQQIDCDPSYPDFCIPSPPPDLDCKDIPQKRFTVLQPDPHRFDGDKDGIGCES